jgi:hypothetical protein
MHPVGSVQGPGCVDQERPGKVRVLYVGAGGWPRLEGHDEHGEAEGVEGRLPLSQLRQMFASGQSPEVSVKHEPEPSGAVLRERVTRAIAVDQLEVHRGGPNEAFTHASILADSADACSRAARAPAAPRETRQSTDGLPGLMAVRAASEGHCPTSGMK